MKDLHEVWSQIPEKSLKEDEIRSILSRKTISEVGYIKRLLLTELYISWAIAIVIFFIQDNIGKEITLIIYTIVFLGSLLNIITLRNIKKLQLSDDVNNFLKSVLKVLKSFVTGFILTIQIIGIFVITAYNFLQEDLSWSDWFLSEQGISIIILFLVIEVILITYVWIFYIRRIYSLKNILREMES